MPKIQTEIFYDVQARMKRQRTVKTLNIFEKIEVDVPEGPADAAARIRIVLSGIPLEGRIIDGSAWLPVEPAPEVSEKHGRHPGRIGSFMPGLGGTLMENDREGGDLLRLRAFDRHFAKMVTRNWFSGATMIDRAEYDATVSKELSSGRDEALAFAAKVAQENCILVDGVVLSNRYEPMLVANGIGGPRIPILVGIIPIDTVAPDVRSSSHDFFGNAPAGMRMTIPDALAADVDLGTHLVGDLEKFVSRKIDTDSMDRSVVLNLVKARATLNAILDIKDVEVMKDLLKDLKSMREKEPLEPGIDDRLVRYVEALSAVSPKFRSDYKWLFQEDVRQNEPEVAQPSM